MTDLVRYQHPPQSSLELAPQAWKLAEKIAGTDFVPAPLRGKPEAVLACILAGHEAGVSPLQALSKIHVIEGRPAMSSELMRALVLQHGHELHYAELSTTRVVAEGRRRGSDRWTRVEWTMDDAKRGGLDGKQNWRRWPRAMLTARATAELCRMLFPDVLAGISYTIEELSDGDVVEDGILNLGPPEVAGTEAPAAPKRATAQRKAITRQQASSEPEERDRPAAEIPELPDADVIDAEIVETEVVEEQPAPELQPEPIADAEVVEDSGEWESGEWESGDFPTDTPPPGDGRRYTGPQVIAIRLAERFGIKGNTAEARAQRLRAISVLLGRDVTSSKDLDAAGVQATIEAIDAWPEGSSPLDDEPATVTEPAGRGGALDDVEAVEPVEAPETASAPPADPPRRRSTPRPQPEQWTGDQWRELLAERKVKVTETMREAQRLAGLRTPPVTLATLDDLAGSGLAGELLGWVEDLSLERRGK